MNYVQAVASIDANRKKAEDLNFDEKPAKRIESFLIAPIHIYRDQNMRDYFFQQCVEKGESNERALSERYPYLFVSDQILTWIVFRTDGNLVAVDLEAYIKGKSAA